jgi:C4-dicarboxylate transporter DctQ subunit
MAGDGRGGPRSWTDDFEETLIALFLGLMTLITFANVIARYVFNDNILWALEATVFLFAWLVLLGASYGVKKSLHLGVDMAIAALSPGKRKLVGLLSIAACLAFSILLLIGSVEYWYPFASKRAFLEVNDIPMPSFLQFIADWLNEGEKYEKLPRFIPYFVLPLSMLLLTYRFLQAGFRIIRGEIYSVIASHEAEEMMEEHIASRTGER